MCPPANTSAARTPPIASGAKLDSLITTHPIVRTKPKVPMNSVTYLRISPPLGLGTGAIKKTPGRAATSDSESLARHPIALLGAPHNSSIKTKDPAQLLDVTDRLNVVHRHLDSAFLVEDQRRP